MNKIFLMVAMIVSLIGGDSYATIVGRMELDHPAQGTTSGVHTSIETIYTTISDNVNSRYFESSGVANSFTTTYRHNLGAAFSQYNVLIYTGIGNSKVRVADPVASGWVIAATGGNPNQEIDVTTPSSGGLHTFSVVIIHGKGSEKLDDLSDVDTTGKEDGQALVYNSGTGNFEPGASGDSSFKLQSFNSINITIKSGIRKRDGEYWCTYDGAGALSTDFNTDLVIATNTIPGDTFVASTKYYLYADKASSSLITRTDDLFVCRAIELTHFYRSTADPDTIDHSRYMLLGSFEINGSSDVGSINPLIPIADDSFKNMVVDNEPCGVIKWSSVPLTTDEGYLLADGAVVSRANYPCLNDKYSSESYAHGNGDGSTTFHLPNLKGRGLIGQDTGDVSFDVIGENAGSKLLLDHTHTSSLTGGVPTNDGGGAGGVDVSVSGSPAASTNSITINVSGTIGTSSTAATTFNMNPYLVERAYIKYTYPTTSIVVPTTEFSTRITSKNTSGKDSKHQVTGLPGGFTGRLDYTCEATRHDNALSHDFPIVGAVYHKTGTQTVDLNLDAYTVDATNYVDLVCSFGARAIALPIDNLTIVTNSDGKLAVDQAALKLSVLSTITAITTLTDGGYQESTVLIDTTSGAYTTTLPVASTMTEQILTLKKIGANTNIATIDGASAETIDGDLTLEMITEGDWIKVISDGSNWHVIGKSFAPQFIFKSASQSLTAGVSAIITGIELVLCKGEYIIEGSITGNIVFTVGNPVSEAKFGLSISGSVAGSLTDFTESSSLYDNNENRGNISGKVNLTTNGETVNILAFADSVGGIPTSYNVFRGSNKIIRIK